ncbi:ATP-dependent zinc metalloprotease FtsH [Spiroplasma endosymbiont of Labia minor]|uniref:ATP-dependent zinc metalloprotease FtsH n=1 Tax=Spiroplasma endosymbiont of Labia minor TaxID=3066305 RepID=UPI0030D619A8
MNKKRNWWFFTLILLIFLALLIFGIVYFLNGSTTQWNIDTLHNYALTGNLQNIHMVVSNNVVTISGYLISDDGAITQFSITIARDAYNLLLLEDWFASLNSLATVSDGSSTPLWLTLLSSFLPFIIMILIYVWIFRMMMKGGGMGGAGGIFGMSKNRARQTKSDVKFSDVAGISEEKAEIVELVDYLKNPSKYASAGARVPKGVLMEGPPGTGKTLLAKAVAGEANVPFFSIAGSEFEEMFVGLGASRVREMFADAKKTAPCIIFIDEIDAVGRKRSANMGSGTNEQTLNQLLVEMDGFGTNSGIIVMAATNRVDVLDSALLRPGRFDRTIQISLPDIREREAILRLHARNKKISPKVDWRRVAERTPGFSGAQLENVLNEAAILMVREKKPIISIQEIDEAIDRVVGGPAKKSRAMTAQDKDIVSYHEAGHALIGLKLDSASKVQKVTIIPRGNAGGYTIMTPKDESVFSSIQDLEASIAGYLGGRAAESIIFGDKNVTTGAHDDLDKATNIARRMVTQFGMSSLGMTKFITMQDDAYGKTTGAYSDETAAKIDAEIAKMLDRSYEIAKKIISEHRDTLELIAESLKILETITAEQIEFINKNKKLPQEVIDEKLKREERKEKEERGEILDFSPDENDDTDPTNNSEEKDK